MAAFAPIPIARLARRRRVEVRRGFRQGRRCKNDSRRGDFPGSSAAAAAAPTATSAARAGRQLEGRRLRRWLRSRIVLGRWQGPDRFDSRQRHAHQVAFLLRGLSPVRTRAIVDAALLQHVGQNHLVVVDLLDGPFETVEGTIGRNGGHDHVDFAVTARPEFRDLDRIEQLPLRLRVRQGFAPQPDPAAKSRQAARRRRLAGIDCLGETWFADNTMKSRRGARSVPC